MRRNPRLPEYLMRDESAINWALQNNEFEYNNIELPYDEILTYEDLCALSEEDLGELRVLDYDRFEQAVLAITILDRTAFYTQFMRETGRADKATLYRAIRVPPLKSPRYKAPPEKPDQGVGVYWSYDYDCAFPHWGGEGETLVLTGEVVPESIDWEMSYLSFVSFGEEECEVRLEERAPILITEINSEELPVPIEATA